MKSARFGFLLSLPLLCHAATALEIEAGADFSLSAFASGAEITSSWQLDERGQISGLAMNYAGANGMRAGAGQIAAGGDDLGFARRSFQGLAFDVPAGKTNFTLFGGNVRTGDSSAPTSNVMGVGLAKPLRNGWTLTAAQILAPRRRDEDRALTTVGLARTRLTKDKTRQSQWNLDFARSASGAGWQAAWSMQNKKLRAQAGFRQVSEGFTTAGNPSLASFRNGFNASLSYRLRPNLSLAVSHAQRSSGDFSSGYQSASLGYSKKGWPSLNLFWQRAAAQTAAGDSVFDSRATDRGFALSHAIAGNTLMLRFDDLQTGNDGSSDKTQRISAGWSRLFGRRTMISASQVWDASQRSGQKIREGYSAVQISHRLKNDWDLSLQLDQHNKGGVEPGSSMLGRVAVAIPLRGGNRLNLQYRMPVAASGSLNWQSTPVLSIGYSHNFSFGKRPALTPNGALAAAGVDMGKIIGRVYEDLNGNKKWDAGEPGLSGVALTTINDFEVKTSGAGQFTVDGLAPGEQRIRLVVKTLPLEFTLTTNEAEIRINVPPSGSATVDYPVQRTGRIRGVVYWDLNRNGKRDSNEKAVANAVVKADGSEIISVTNENGQYLLDGLAPKGWNVSVDTGYIGEDVEATTPAPSVQVAPNGEVTGIELGVAQKEREVETGFVKSVE